MGTPELPEFIDIDEAAKLMGRTSKTVLQYVLDGHLQCYVYDSDYGNFIDFETHETGTWAGTTKPQLVYEPMRHINPKETHIWVTFPELTRTANGKTFTRPAQHCTITPEEIRLSTEEINTLLSDDGAQTTETRKAALTLKARHTADLDKLIETVKRAVDAAIENHLRSNNKKMIVNHIQFLKDAGISGNDRAKRKIKTYIEHEYGGKGYSAIGHAPPKNGDYFLNH